jgi:hypothetical protein
MAWGDAPTLVTSLSGTATPQVITGVTIAAGTTGYVCVSYEDSFRTISSVADSAGNTWVVASQFKNGGDNSTVALLVGNIANALSGGTITVTYSSTGGLSAGRYEVYSSDGVVTSSIVDQVATNAGGFTSAPSTGVTPTTTQADELCIGVLGSRNAGAATMTPPTNFLEANGDGSVSGTCKLYVVYRYVSSTGTYGGAASASGSAQWCGTIATVKKAAGGGTFSKSGGIQSVGSVGGAKAFSASKSNGIQSAGTIGGALPAPSQIARPVADGNITGFLPSTGIDIYAVLDEVVPDDNDYAESGLSPSGNKFRIKLDILNPPPAGTKTIRWRPFKDTAGGNQHNDVLRLYEGGDETFGSGTLLQTFTRNNIPGLGSEITYEEDVTATITTPWNLWAEIEATEV